MRIFANRAPPRTRTRLACEQPKDVARNAMQRLPRGQDGLDVWQQGFHDLTPAGHGPARVEVVLKLSQEIGLVVRLSANHRAINVLQGRFNLRYVDEATVDYHLQFRVVALEPINALVVQRRKEPGRRCERRRSDHEKAFRRPARSRR